MLVPLTMRIVPIEETGKYVGKVMSGLLIGIMIARPLSIGITEWFGWRMVFLFSLIILVAVLLLLIKFLPNYEVVSNSNMSYSNLIASMVKLLLHTSPLQQRAFITHVYLQHLVFIGQLFQSYYGQNHYISQIMKLHCLICCNSWSFINSYYW